MNQKSKLFTSLTVAVLAALVFFINLAFIAKNIPLTPEISGTLALTALVSAVTATLATRFAYHYFQGVLSPEKKPR
jgi:hypothetical protein